MSGTATECVAIACAGAFGQLASRIAIVKGRNRIARSKCYEATIHRRARVAHLAESGAVVERYIAINISSHTAIACHTAAVACNIDICHYILYKHIAAVITCKGTEVNALNSGSTFNIQVADSSVVQAFEETTMVADSGIIVCDLMTFAIEGAGIRAINHDVASQFDVGRKVCFQSGVAATYCFRESDKVFECGNLHSRFHRFVATNLHEVPATGIAVTRRFGCLVVIIAHFLLGEAVASTVGAEIALHMKRVFRLVVCHIEVAFAFC